MNWNISAGRPVYVQLVEQLELASEVNPRHSAPHDLCGERAGKAEKGDEQQGVTCQAERKREVLRCKIAISVPIAQSIRKKEYSAAGRSDARCCRRRFVICLAGHP